MFATVGKGAMNLWEMLQAKAKADEVATQGTPAPTPQAPGAGQLYSPMSGIPSSLKIDDATNAPVTTGTSNPGMNLPLKSISVSRPMGYARPATQEDDGAYVKQLMDQYGEASQRSSVEQRDGIGQLEDRIRQYEENQNPLAHANFGPLMAFSDSMTGANTAGAYKAPKSMNEFNAEMINLQDALQKRKGDLSKQEADVLKDKISLYLKDKDDPNKMMMQMMRMNYMQAGIDAMGRNFGNKVGEQQQSMEETFLKSDDAMKIKANSRYANLLNNYKNLVNKYGYQPAGPGAKALETAFMEVGTAYKDAKGLGALTGPDWDIVKGSITPMTGAGGGVRNVLAGGAKSVVGGIDSLMSNAENDMYMHRNSASTVFPEQFVDSYVSNVRKARPVPPKQKKAAQPMPTPQSPPQSDRREWPPGSGKYFKLVNDQWVPE